MESWNHLSEKRNETERNSTDVKAEVTPKLPLNMMLSNIQVNQNVQNSLNIDRANFGRIW